MSSSRFLPGTVDIEAGETVVWANTGTRNHTVTAYESGIPGEAAYFASGGYDSESAARDAWLNEPYGGAIRANETYRHTFEVPGEYQYFCVPHEPSGMAGKVIVR
jgi:plastocyanin